VAIDLDGERPWRRRFREAGWSGLKRGGRLGFRAQVGGGDATRVRVAHIHGCQRCRRQWPWGGGSSSSPTPCVTGKCRGRGTRLGWLACGPHM
jgi:hypothetical protein